MRLCFLNKNVQDGQSGGWQRDGLNGKRAACKDRSTGNKRESHEERGAVSWE